MTYLEFQKQNIGPIIDIKNVVNFFGKIDRRRLFEWQKNGYIKKIVSNLYIDQRFELSDNWLKHTAKLIYQPSYIALDLALSFYNFIPEAVFQITSITTRRCSVFDTAVGSFAYNTIKPKLFFGYELQHTNDGASFYISDREKTILDKLYYLPEKNIKETLIELRLNQKEILKTISSEKFQLYLKYYSSRSMNNKIKILKKVADA